MPRQHLDACTVAVQHMRRCLKMECGGKHPACAQSRFSFGTHEPHSVPHLSCRCNCAKSAPVASTARISVAETSKQLHTVSPRLKLPRGVADTGAGNTAGDGLVTALRLAQNPHVLARARQLESHLPP